MTLPSLQTHQGASPDESLILAFAMDAILAQGLSPCRPVVAFQNLEAMFAASAEDGLLLIGEGFTLLPFLFGNRLVGLCSHWSHSRLKNISERM